MTQLLEQAIAELTRLSDEKQDAMAALILEELEDEQRWDAAFQASEVPLKRIADKVRADVRAEGSIQFPLTISDASVSGSLTAMPMMSKYVTTIEVRGDE